MLNEAEVVYLPTSNHPIIFRYTIESVAGLVKYWGNYSSTAAVAFLCEEKRMIDHTFWRTIP